MKEKIIYLSGLNGIRAIASIAVVISHITLSFKSFGLDPYIFGTYDDGNPRTLDLAGYGVSMFFALSGFLITYLLWAEKEKQSIQIKKFYLRRILRIWPLYYGYFVISLLVIWVFNIDYLPNSIFYYLFYGANIPFIIGGTLPFLGHFWSLGVEEQFYLFWPWVNRMKKKNIMKFIVSVITLLIFTKIYLHIFIPNTILETTIHVTRFHCMLIGGLFAILYRQKNVLFIKLTTNRYVQIFAWFIMFLVAINRFHIASFLDNEFLTFITGIIIIGQITKTGLVNLENRIMDFLGKISYGIYVIHPILIYLYSKILINVTQYEILNYFIVYIVIIGSTILVSYLSFRFFETPFLNIKKKKFTVIKSMGVKNNTQHAI